MRQLLPCDTIEVTMVSLFCMIYPHQLINFKDQTLGIELYSNFLSRTLNKTTQFTYLSQKVYHRFSLSLSFYFHVRHIMTQVVQTNCRFMYLQNKHINLMLVYSQPKRLVKYSLVYKTYIVTHLCVKVCSLSCFHSSFNYHTRLHNNFDFSNN